MQTIPTGRTSELVLRPREVVRLREATPSEAVKESTSAGETACATSPEPVLSMVGQAVSPAALACEGFFHSFLASGLTVAANLTFTALVVALAITSGAGATGSRVVFTTPEEAAGTLLTAIESGNYPLFLSVAGPQMAGFWGTGDPERDALDRNSFVIDARRNGIRPDSAPGNQQVFYVGSLREPFPAPLVPTDGGWGFDDEAGFGELAARQIRRNEVAVIELCQRFREAEFVYLGMAISGEPGFALKIRSTPGQHDGLFWSDAGAEDDSPMGPPFAAAAFAERQPGDGTRPLFGYYFKILTAQGPSVAGGALDYRTNGRLRKGFALIAWPAEYGVNGTRSFLVNHFGDVYQKDLGTDTPRIASNMAVFNPDRSWSRFNGTD